MNMHLLRQSQIAERGFCANCGTLQFFHHLENGRANLMIGTLDTITKIENTSATENNGAAWAAAIKASTSLHPDHDTSAWEVKRREEARATR